MRTTPTMAVAMSLLVLTTSAQAVYREPTVPQTDHSEQIPNKTIKLNRDDDAPPVTTKKPVREVKPREPEHKPVRQTARRRPDDDRPPPRDQGLSPDAAAALGTAIGIGAGIGLGGMMRGRGGDDMRGMRDR